LTFFKRFLTNGKLNLLANIFAVRANSKFKFVGAAEGKNINSQSYYKNKCLDSSHYASFHFSYL